MTSTTNNHPWLAYVDSILCGRVPACQLVHMACQRFLDDLKSDRWEFHEENVYRVAKFAQLLPVVEGPLAGKRIRLMDWQWFAIANLFGFTDKNGNRRFRQGTVFLPRGNAKSAFGSILSLYMLCADGEVSAKVYSAAVTLDQAKLVWNLAKQMLQQTPELIEKYKLAITDNNSGSKIKHQNGGFLTPLSSSPKGLEGLNVHFAVIDEIAQHPNASVYNALITATSKRRHPMILNISTASDNTQGIGKARWNYGVKVLERQHTDERHFVLIYTIDEGDDPHDENSWYKANPSLGLTTMPEVIETALIQSKESPAEEVSVFTRFFNIWMQSESSIFSISKLRECADPKLKIEDFRYQECHIGVDLAYRSDLASVAITFPRIIKGDMHYYCFYRTYLNEEAVKKGWSQNYPKWQRDGLIKVNPGNETSLRVIVDDVVDLAKIYKVKSVCIDRYAAAATSFLFSEHGLPVITFPMMTINLSPPTREFELAYRGGRFHYDGNPVLEWNVGCVIGHYDANNNIHPKKDLTKQTDKIDLFISTVMTIAKCMEEPVKPSVYESRGLRFV